MLDKIGLIFGHEKKKNTIIFGKEMDEYKGIGMTIFHLMRKHTIFLF